MQDKIVTVQIWDTAGQERYRSLASTFYKGAECCFLVYDITSNRSFDSLGGWHSDFLAAIDTKDPKQFPFIVLGNKHDKAESREVAEVKGKEWAKEIGAEFFETSAKDQTGVEEALRESINLILNNQTKFIKAIQGANLHINIHKHKKAKSSCCH